MQKEIRFDLRRVIGHFFGIVGIILIGVSQSDAGTSQRDLPNLNLWAGAIMLTFAFVMIGISYLQPMDRTQK